MTTLVGILILSILTKNPILLTFVNLFAKTRKGIFSRFFKQLITKIRKETLMRIANLGYNPVNKQTNNKILHLKERL